MTGTDLIVLAPWLAFAMGLAIICLILLRSRRASGARRSPRLMSGPAGAVSRPGRAPADRDTDRGLHPQEAICSQNKAKA